MAYTHHESISYETTFAKGAKGLEVEIKPVSGMADGYKIARGETAITGSGEVVTGLTTIVEAVACLKDDIALTANEISVATSATAGNILLKVWKPTGAADCTPIAATTAKTVRWVAIGT